MKRRLYQIAIIIVSLFIIQGLSRSLVELWKQRDWVRKSEQELTRLKQQEQDLEKQKEYYQSDEYVEKIAREKLMLGKEGEEVVILPRQHNDNEAPISTNKPINTNEQTNENLPNWKKWMKAFEL